MRNILGVATFAFFLPVVTDALTPAVTSSYIFVPGKVLPGPLPPSSYKISRNVTLGQCAADCSLQYHLNQFHCYAFEFVPATKLCVLTNVTSLVLKGGFLGLISNSNMNYYERSKGMYAKLFQPYPGQVLSDQRSYFTVFHNMTLEKCALFCLLETRDTCMSFSYSVNKHVCGLSKVFYAEDNGQKLVSSEDYSHYQYFSSWPCNATIPWNYSPRAIASPYFPYASVKDINCYLKLEAPKGKQIDLVFSTFFTQSNLCIYQDGGITVYDGAPDRRTELSRLCSSENFVDRRFQSSNGYLFINFATGSVPMAFKAVFDFIEVDPCLKSPCKNSGTCSSKDGLLTCTCLAGYTGSECETNIDECASSPCLLGGKCVDMVNRYKCECPNMLGGENCDKFVGLCYLDPCENGGKCSPRGTDQYQCDCPLGWVGENCTRNVPNPCSSEPCSYGATCLPDYAEGTFTCDCVPGFTGKQCETNIDECASDPCYHNIPCTDLINDYRCQCPSFMAGKRCEQFVGKCKENPCLNGKCIPTGRDNYTCECDAAYTGKHCDSLYINYCDPNPCKHGKCSSFNDGPSCECDFGFDGFLCDRRINYCSGVNCTHGECINTDDSFHCNCIPGFQGRYCNETINHCLDAECNGGYCINTMTSHFCVCSGGKTGVTCDSESRCDESVCKNGTCIDTNGVSICSCNPDFTGVECDSPIDYCITQPCQYGKCSNEPGGFKCACEENYTGETCTYEIDHCKHNRCIYGFCQNLEDNFQCICAVGYHGNFCQYKPGELEPTTTTEAQPSTQLLKTSTERTFVDILTSSSTGASTSGKYACTTESCIHGICEPDFPNVCLCLPGYHGDKCDAFQGCLIHDPCYNGTCEDIPNGFKCSCEKGFKGEMCEKRIPEEDPCKKISCKNGGTCISARPKRSSAYHCDCQDGFYGDLCEFDILCDLHPCENGTCVSVGNTIRCELNSLSGSSNIMPSGLGNINNITEKHKINFVERGRERNPSPKRDIFAVDIEG